MPPLNPIECFPFSEEPSPHRDLTKLPATVDRGFFYVKDRIAEACDAGSTPTQGFRPSSRSVKDARLTAGSRLTIRSSGSLGVTGGHVEGAKGERVEWGRDLTMRKTGSLKPARIGKNARKRAARKILAAHGITA